MVVQFLMSNYKALDIKQFFLVMKEIRRKQHVPAGEKKCPAGPKFCALQLLAPLVGPQVFVIVLTTGTQASAARPNASFTQVFYQTPDASTANQQCIWLRRHQNHKQKMQQQQQQQQETKKFV